MTAPAPLPHAGPVRVPLVDGARLPLAFVALGLGAFAVGAGWSVGAGVPMEQPYFHPHVVALAHLWLPGFLLSICLGASYQLMPVVLGVPLRAARSVLRWHAGLHAVGVVALVTGLARADYLLAGAGGLALTIGVSLFAAATWATFAASSRRDAAAWSFPLAALWLSGTAAAGVMLAANRHAPFLPLSVLDLLAAHAHLGLVGYFVSLLQGVTFQLLPMFTMGTAARPRWALAGLGATQAGLPLLAAGFAWSAPVLQRVGAGILLGGLAASGVAWVATLRARRRRKLDPGVRAFVLGVGGLAVAAVAGAGLAFDVMPAPRAAAAVGMYGVLVVAGGLSLCVLGMLSKILPFLVWMKAYGPRVGREPVPIATALASRTLEYSWLTAHAAGSVLLAVGLLAGAEVVAVLGGGLLLAGAACYLANAVRVVSHLWRRRAGGPREIPAITVPSPPPTL